MFLDTYMFLAYVAMNLGRNEVCLNTLGNTMDSLNLVYDPPLTEQEKEFLIPCIYSRYDSEQENVANPVKLWEFGPIFISNTKELVEECLKQEPEGWHNCIRIEEESGEKKSLYYYHGVLFDSNGETELMGLKVGLKHRKDVRKITNLNYVSFHMGGRDIENLERDNNFHYNEGGNCILNEWKESPYKIWLNNDNEFFLVIREDEESEFYEVPYDLNIEQLAGRIGQYKMCAETTIGPVTTTFVSSQTSESLSTSTEVGSSIPTDSARNCTKAPLGFWFAMISNDHHKCNLYVGSYKHTVLAALNSISMILTLLAAFTFRYRVSTAILITMNLIVLITLLTLNIVFHFVCFVQSVTKEICY